MNFLIEQFHRRQAILKTRSSTSGRSPSVAPLFTADVLTGDEPQSNDQRLISYLQKREGMKAPTISEAVSSVRVKRLVPVRVKGIAA